MSFFLNLQDDVLEFCQELQAISTFQRKQVKRWINKGYYDFVKRTSCIQDVIDITTVADQESYTSSDTANLAFVYKPYEVRHIESGKTERGEILLPYPGGHGALSDIIQTGTPTHYWTRGVHTRGEFELGTVMVDSSSGNTIRVYAFMFPTADLSDNEDEPLMKEAWQDALVNYAVWKLFSLYSHTSKAWGNKAMEHRGLYLEDVAIANDTMFTESMDNFDQVQDVYK